MEEKIQSCYRGSSYCGRNYYTNNILIALASTIFLTTVTLNAESLFFEAEHFDDIPKSGFFYNAPGWYAKRHNYASGGGLAVTHCPGSVMTRQFSSLLAPGKYQIFIRFARNRSQNTHNTIEAALIAADGKKFSANIDFNKNGSGYGWIPATIETDQPVKSLRITAGLVESLGIGDDPEFQLPMIILDSIIITNEQTKFIPDPLRGRDTLEFVDKSRDPRINAETIAYPSVEVTPEYQNLPSRPRFVPKHNLLRNSGFELALKGNFGSQMPVFTGNNLDSNCLSAEKPFEGRYSVKLNGMVQNPFDDYSGSAKPIIYGNGFKLAAFDRFNRTLLKGPHLFSIYARTNGKPVKLNIAGKSFDVKHTDWRRYEVAVNPTRAMENIAGFTSSDRDASVWFDAMQLESGTVATPYTPLDGLEIGFQSHARANIFYSGGGLELELVVSSAKAEQYRIKYRLLDYALRICGSGEFLIDSESGKTVSRPVNIPFNRLGAYLFVYEVDGRPEQAWAFPVVVTPKPQGPLPLLGFIGSSNVETAEIARHIGFGRMISLNDRFTYFNLMWLKAGEMRFYDKYFKLWEQYGIDYVFDRPSFSPPGWTSNVPARSGAAAHMEPNIGFDAWREFWNTATRQLGYIKYWMASDELSYHRAPAEAVKYVDIATREIRKNIPNATVILSTQSLGLREMMRLSPGLDVGDAIGGSRHGVERNMLFYDRLDKDQFHKKYWIIGVGWIARDWVELIDFESFKPIDSKWPAYVNSTWSPIPDLFEEMAIVGVEQYCLYTAKFDAGSDYCSIFSPMNSIRPFGAAYINGVKFLADCSRGDTIPLDKAVGVSAAYVMKNGRACIMLRSLGRFNLTQINLSLPLDKVKMYDLTLTPITPTNIYPLLPAEALYIEDAGMGTPALLAAIRTINTTTPDKERRLVMDAPDGRLRLVTMKQGCPVAETLLPQEAGVNYSLDQSGRKFANNWCTVARESVTAPKLDGRLDDTAWHGAVPAFIYATPSLDGSYGAMQGIKNFATIEKAEDLSAVFYACHNSDAIYFGVNALGKLEMGSTLTIKLDADLTGDIDNDEFNQDDFIITVPIDRAKSQFRVPIKNFNGTEHGYCDVNVVFNSVGATLEIKLPVAAINLGKNRTIGLNMELSDIFKGENRILSWTSGYAPINSPAGFGQLVLSK